MNYFFRDNTKDQRRSTMYESEFYVVEFPSVTRGGGTSDIDAAQRIKRTLCTQYHIIPAQSVSTAGYRPGTAGCWRRV